MGTIINGLLIGITLLIGSIILEIKRTKNQYYIKQIKEQRNDN